MSDIKATVKELERLEREASPAPWYTNTWESESGSRAAVGPPHVEDWNYDALGGAEDDALLLAAARNAMPSLLAELRRLWAIEKAAMSLREARSREDIAAIGSDPDAHEALHEYEVALSASEHAEAALFAALPPLPGAGSTE